MQGVQPDRVVAHGTQQGAFGIVACRRIFLCCRLQIQGMLCIACGQAQLFQHVLCRLHQFGPLFDQQVATFGLGRVDGAGDRHHVAALLKGLFGRDE